MKNIYSKVLNYIKDNTITFHVISSVSNSSRTSGEAPPPPRYVITKTKEPIKIGRDLMLPKIYVAKRQIQIGLI